MSELKRIKEIMNIQEDMKVRTAPIPTKGLVKVIEFVLNQYEIDVNFSTIEPDVNIIDTILSNLKLIGSKNLGLESADYIYAFIKENGSLLNDLNFNHEDYMIPQKKMFKWTGIEEYTAYHQDTWTGKEEGYSKDFLEYSIDSGDFDISAGSVETEDMLDTFDTRTYLDSIEEVPMNELIERENTSIIEELKKINSIILL
jgi:hypothetical protein